MTLRERLKAVTNNFAWEQDWNIQEYAVHKRDIEYRRGKAAAYGDVVNVLNEVLEEFPEEPVVKDKLTLTELARELRKLFMFKYLTVSNTNGWCITVWKYFRPEYKDDEWIGCYMAFDIYPDELRCSIDFSEYVDADGDVDFSKCIVEVPDDIE